MNRTLPMLALLALLLPALCTAQAPATSTDFDTAASAYYKTNPDELPIYNGRQHPGYGLNILGDAYFRMHEWQPGSVFYDGRWYSDLQIKYDISADQVILQGLDGTAATMNRERIREFRIGDSHFIRSPWKISEAPTFYEVLAEGQLTLIAFHKRIYEIDLDVKPSFRYAVQFFIVADGILHPVRTRKDVLKMMGDKRSRANASLRSSGLEFNKDKEFAMTHLVRFYNNN